MSVSNCTHMYISNNYHKISFTSPFEVAPAKNSVENLVNLHRMRMHGYCKYDFSIIIPLRNCTCLSTSSVLIYLIVFTVRWYDVRS